MPDNTSAAPGRARLVTAFLALYVIWGSSYLFIKWTVAGIPPFVAAALRHGTAGVVLYVWARARGAPRPSLRLWGVAAFVGALLLTCGNGSVNWASQRVPTGLSALIVSSVPIWIVAVDWLRPRGVKPSRRTVAGLVLGTLGIAGLVWSAGGVSARGSSTSVVPACVVILAGSVAWASGTILSRELPRPAHGALATAMQMTAAGLVLVPISWLTGDLARFDPAEVTAASWWSLAYLIVAGSLIGFSAYSWLLRVSTPAKVATYAYVNPIVAVALGRAFAGERLTPATFGAAAMILAAVAAITVPRPAMLRQVFGAR
jgi:drug/metabolite transporter (DMT)-like permease